MGAQGILRSLGADADELLRHHINRALHGPGRPLATYDAKIAHLLRERLGRSD